MTSYPHLSRAPIVEALFDIRVTCPGDFDVQALIEVGKRELGEDYTSFKEHFVFEAKFSPGKDKTEMNSSHENRLAGTFFRSSDEKTIIQFREDGYTFNRLKPYTSWDELFPNALKFFECYWDAASPSRIDRVGLRYINRIDVPIPVKDLGEYFTIPPVIPDGLPQSLIEGQSRVVVEDQASGSVVAITQAVQRPSNPDFVSLLVDIDAFRVERVSRESIAETFLGLRELKNAAFFGCLTEQEWRKYE